MELRLLGSVEIDTAGQTLNVGVPQRRAVLAALAVDAGRLVSREVLIDRVWGSSAPARVESGIYAHMTALRKVLEHASGLDPGRPATLEREPGGYRLCLPPESLDLRRFRQLAAAAGGRDVPDAERARLLTQALAQWRGTALTGVPGEWAARMRDGWNQERLGATVAWARARSVVGDAESTLGPLSELAAEHPLAESVVAELLRALAAVGRGADALDRYGKLRQRLVEELGTEPGPELRAVHSQLLRGAWPVRPAAPVTVASTAPPESGDADAARGAPTQGGASTEPSPDVPRQLPAPPRLFTGRAAELADLDRVHDESTVVITAIDGMAGVGKTALAVQAAHRMVERYPDGQLFIDLHGYTHRVAPTEPAAALDRMLRTLGVPGERIPANVDERAGLYRSRLADQRMVIVLDNAATEAQVTPLLPGAPGCLVLVTSRRRLVGLDHTHTLSLDTLPPPDAATLLRHTAGESRLAGQPPDVVAQLVELCGRLPLAIRIAAARLRSHPTWDLSHLTDLLRDRQRLLVELEAGQRSVTATLDLSYQDLSAGQRRLYRLLGLHPGPDIDPYAAAALLDATLPEAGRLLDQLLEAHLLQEPVPGRYRFHDLVRAHAAHTATRDESGYAGRVALDRLLDYYRHTAAMAMDAAYPYEWERRPRVPRACTPSPALSDPDALDWLDDELPNLLAAAAYATEHDRPEHLLHLSTILHRHLRSHGPLHDAVTLHQQALTVARATGDQAAELAALVCLGHVHRLVGRRGPAIDHYQQALRLAGITGNRHGELDALAGLGNIHRMQGRYEQATDHLGRALRLARATGDRTAELDAVVGLGRIHLTQGRYEQATEHYRQALRLARATGHRTGELNALHGLGQVDRREGRYGQATEHYQQALRLARATGHHAGEQAALHGLGQVYRRQGRYRQAADHYQRLLDLARQGGNRNWQFEARQGLGWIHQATGDPHAALNHHNQALALATELGQPQDEARAHDGIAHAHHTLHEDEPARAHWQHALEILTRLGTDHTTDEETNVAAIRAHLDGRYDSPQ